MSSRFPNGLNAVVAAGASVGSDCNAEKEEEDESVVEVDIIHVSITFL